MDHRSRFIILALAILFSAFRVIRYVRAGTSRRPTALPPATGLVLDRVGESAVSPIDPPQPGGARGQAVARAVAIAGTLALWAGLFATPALSQQRVIPRVLLGALGTAWLVQLSRSLAARMGTDPATPQDQNPIH